MSDVEIQIEKGVPVPIEIPTHGRHPIYPFARMEVGDSFTVPSSLAKRVSFAASAHGKKYDKRFITRTRVNTTRCWRIA